MWDKNSGSKNSVKDHYFKLATSGKIDEDRACSQSSFSRTKRNYHHHYHHRGRRKKYPGRRTVPSSQLKPRRGCRWMRATRSSSGYVLLCAGRKVGVRHGSTYLVWALKYRDKLTSRSILARNRASRGQSPSHGAELPRRRVNRLLWSHHRASATATNKVKGFHNLFFFLYIFFIVEIHDDFEQNCHCKTSLFLCLQFKTFSIPLEIIILSKTSASFLNKINITVYDFRLSVKKVLKIFFTSFLKNLKKIFSKNVLWPFSCLQWNIICLKISLKI